MTFYRNFSSRKAKWKKKVRKMDLTVLDFINKFKRGDPKIPIRAYKDLGRSIMDIGEKGEILLKEAVELGMYDRVIYEMRDILNDLGELSARVKDLAEKKWGAKMPTFPLYAPAVAAATELMKQAKSVRELDKLVKKEGKKNE